ncbi:MAG: hypothetical protein DWQ07_09795 [Chloroflexi bacterium]|nr:MAG: hypothetical protein DWQ07_09795 [Chloroflexota bacterium]MBL1192994.1 hypothetical protein [Chloroflexota bacterium]NOH10287.1 tetratricopeptide repeat-containing protein [Chloroflexota bacterium]
MTDLPKIDELWDYNKPEQTEQQFRELLPQAQASGDIPYHAELLTQLARTQSLQRKFNEAHAILDDAEALLGQAGARARVRYLLERGRTFNSLGKKEQAKPLFVEAWDLGREVGEEGLAVDAAHMVAIAESGDAVLAWNLKAMEYAEASTDPDARRWLGSLFNNIGWTYHDQNEFEKALEMFEQALVARREQDDAENIRVAQWCVARCLRSLKRIEEALAIQQNLLAEYEELGQPSGYTQEEMGENLLALNREAEARPHFAEAYAILSQDAWLVENEKERVERLKELGK